MKKIRFLRAVTATHAISTGGPIVTERKPGEAYQGIILTVDRKDCVFAEGEEIKASWLQLEGELRLVSSEMDKRQGAILDGEVEGTDFEFID